jgi:DNA-binding MurR/RpiR family transcriptional regulator
MIAVLNLLVTAVATRLRRSATDRLDRIEAAWHETLVDRTS